MFAFERRGVTHRLFRTRRLQTIIGAGRGEQPSEKEPGVLVLFSLSGEGRPMHPPPFSPTHKLSDWPECRLEVQCGCGRTTVIPTQLMRAEEGDQAIGLLVRRLRCSVCQGRPAQAWLVAGPHRSCCGGPIALDWAVEIRVV